MVQVPPLRICVVQVSPLGICVAQVPPLRICVVQVPPLGICMPGSPAEDLHARFPHWGSACQVPPGEPGDRPPSDVISQYIYHAFQMALLVIVLAGGTWRRCEELG